MIFHEILSRTNAVNNTLKVNTLKFHIRITTQIIAVIAVTRNKTLSHSIILIIFILCFNFLLISSNLF